MDRTTKAPPGPERGDQGATETQQGDGGSPRGAVDLTVPHAGDVSRELGSLADLMRKPGTLAEPREVDGDG